MSEIKYRVFTCAVCGGEMYDADPMELKTIDGVAVRLWLCSPECAWQGGRRSTLCLSSSPTFADLKILFRDDGIEVP